MHRGNKRNSLANGSHELNARLRERKRSRLTLAFALLSTLLLWAAASSAIPAAQKTPPAKPINLNTATIDQLEQLPGVGPVTANDIIQFRKKSGPFRSVNDLLAIRRITKARLEKMRPYITIGPPPAKPHPNPAPPPKPAG
jgi:competence ComEA-like helix-hairpin-helix protein